MNKNITDIYSLTFKFKNTKNKQIKILKEQILNH